MEKLVLCTQPSWHRVCPKAELQSAGSLLWKWNLEPKQNLPPVLRGLKPIRKDKFTVTQFFKKKINCNFVLEL